MGEGRRMSRLGEGVQDAGSRAVGEIEFARGFRGKVVGRDLRNFGAEGLGSDCFAR